MGSVSFKPLGDRVLIKPDEVTNQTEGGILLPETAKEKPSQGTVVAVGSTMELVVGDHVLYPQYSGKTIKLTEGEFLVFNVEDIYGVVSSIVKS